MECGNGYDADDYDFCQLLFLLIFCICGGWSISFVVRIDFNMIWQNGAYVEMERKDIDGMKRRLLIMYKSHSTRILLKV